MKSRILKTSIGSTIFLLLIISVIALLQPVYIKIYGILESEKTKIINTVSEKTGLEISYESVSPLVLFSLNVRGVSLSDAESGNVLLTAKRISVSYKISQFFSENPVAAISKISVNGITVEYDALAENSFADRVKSLISESRSSSADEKSEFSEKSESGGDGGLKKSGSLNGFSLNIPFDVEFKDISVHYGNGKTDFTVSVKNILLDSAENSGVRLETSGRVRLTVLGAKNLRTIFGTEFSLSGTLFNNLEGSTALVRFFDDRGAHFTVSKLDLLFHYADSELSLRTMRSIFPFNFLLAVNPSEKRVKFSAIANEFSPFQFLKVRKNIEGIERLSDSTVSGALDFSFALFEDKTPSSLSDFFNSLESLDFGIDLDFGISEKLMGMPLNLVFKAEGDKNLISVEKISAKGPSIDAEFAGIYDIPNAAPSGTFTLSHLELLNGGTMQTEVYIDSLENGFVCFAPQLFMNDRSFTALQLSVIPSGNSADFVFEFDDYSHIDYGSSGHVRLDGSFIGGESKLVQASVSMNDMFVDSVALSAAFFMNENVSSKITNISDTLSQYIFSNEIYFTTDFSSFSFNAPFFIVANTVKENQLLTFSMDGSNQTVSLSNLDVQFGEQTVNAVAGADFAGSINDISFFLNIVINSMPYNFMGSYSEGYLGVAGDYGFDVAVLFDKNTSGTVKFNSMPLKAGDTILANTLDSSFSLETSDDSPPSNFLSGLNVQIHNFETERISSVYRINPHFAFSGSLNQYGFIFENIAYSDSVSALGGDGSILWNLNGRILDSILVDLNASSIIDSESLSVRAEFMNPEQHAFSMERLLNDFYLSGEITVNKFPAARIMQNQNSDNTISADLIATGTPANPFVSVTLHESSVNVAGYPLNFSGFVSLDDTGINATSINGDWGNFSLYGGEISFDINNFSGTAGATLDGRAVGMDFSVPFTLELSSVSPDSAPGENFVAILRSDSITGSLFPSEKKLLLTVTKLGSNFDFMFGSGNDIHGSFNTDGTVFAQSGEITPIKFTLDGKIENSNLNINITNLSADLGEVSEFINIPKVTFSEGTLNGALRIFGLTTDPEFTGIVDIKDPRFKIPMLSKENFSASQVRGIADQNEFFVRPTAFKVGRGFMDVGLMVIFDRWSLDRMDVTVKTKENSLVPAELSLPYVNYKGDTGLDLQLAVTPDYRQIVGAIFGENATISLVTSSLQAAIYRDEYYESDDLKESVPIATDVELIAGQRVQILYNPLIRGLIAPDARLNLSIDTGSDTFSMRGDVSLRGGEVAWLNRNFYMKEGRILFNETQNSVNPRITVRAETRERDENGAQVTITLSAQNQPLQNFNPQLSASPAKSEREIMELLGQVVVADSDSVASLAMAGGDYLVQTTVIRRIENALRELCNFDIFSIRTNILQNAVRYAVSSNSSGNDITFGNYLDNSTVYIGKYFGSNLYVDALMHWTYDESKLDDDISIRGLVFQPEIGLEMSSPYVNIRLGVAPDLDAIQNNMWVSSTFVTLSWKFDF